MSGGAASRACGRGERVQAYNELEYCLVYKNELERKKYLSPDLKVGANEMSAPRQSLKMGSRTRLMLVQL